MRPRRRSPRGALPAAVARSCPLRPAVSKRCSCVRDPGRAGRAPGPVAACQPLAIRRVHHPVSGVFPSPHSRSTTPWAMAGYADEARAAHRHCWSRQYLSPCSCPSRRRGLELAGLADGAGGGLVAAPHGLPVDRAAHPLRRSFRPRAASAVAGTWRYEIVVSSSSLRLRPVALEAAVGRSRRTSACHCGGLRDAVVVLLGAAATLSVVSVVDRLGDLVDASGDGCSSLADDGGADGRVYTGLHDRPLGRLTAGGLAARPASRERSVTAA